MAFAATLSTQEPRAPSIGPLKVQIYTWTAASGDTTGSFSAAGLSSVRHCIVDGMGKGMSAAPTFSGNTVSLTFADPVATVGGTIMVFGI